MKKDVSPHQNKIKNSYDEWYQKCIISDNTQMICSSKKYTPDPSKFISDYFEQRRIDNLCKRFLNGVLTYWI